LLAFIFWLWNIYDAYQLAAKPAPVVYNNIYNNNNNNN